MQRHFRTSEELCEYVAALSPEVLLSFSCGKDSIGCWAQVKRYFTRVRVFYMYLVPGLSFVEDALKYYEDKFQSEIVQMPHPSLYRMLTGLVFQTPERCGAIEEANLTTYSYDQCAREVMDYYGLPRTTFVAHGTRCVDSLQRRAAIKMWGALNPRRRTFMAIYDWTADRLTECFRDNGIRLPADYMMFGRSFDGVDDRFLGPIREMYPADYKRILEWFPLAQLELKRAEWRAKHG